ncbi:hypothetical protein Megpolyxen_02004 (plasmid) [Candidatus Megaera polyxenophila]|nr:hypothetical protein Megpolyxen_02004 [Candidatus Megaera polyxenophila]
MKGKKKVGNNDEVNLPELYFEYIRQIWQEVYNSNKTYGKDNKAYLKALCSKLENKFYENEVMPWDNFKEKKSEKAILEAINISVDKCKQGLMLEKQSSLLHEEQITQKVLQQYKSYSKFTDPLIEKNSEEINEQILALNAMSRIFSKQPYSSLVYIAGKKELYLGTNSDYKDTSLQKMQKELASNLLIKNSHLQTISRLFEKFIQEPDNTKITQELLEYMQKDKNPILGNILEQMKLQKHNIEPKTVMDVLISKKEMLLIQKYGFHEDIIIESYPFGHAEMNALALARGIYNKNGDIIVPVEQDTKHYIIGLASASYGKIDTRSGEPQGKNPFSCMGCSCEIEVLKKIAGLKISIGYTSVDSMHFSEFYRPSLNIISSPELTKAWCKEIELSVTNPQQIMEQRTQKLIFDYNEEKKQDDKLKSLEGKNKDVNITSSTTPEKLLEIIQYYPRTAFAENGFKPINHENEAVDWQRGWYSEAMILLLLRACNQNCLVVDAINTVNVRIIRETLDYKLSLLDEGDTKIQLSDIVKTNLTMDNKLKTINEVLQSKYNYFKTLFKLDLNTEILEIEIINSIYEHLPEKFKTEDKIESLKNCKISTEYSLYQITEKEFLSDKIKDFMISNNNYMIIPINIGDAHWTAFIVERYTKKIYYIDPKGDLVGEGPIDEVLKEITQALEAEQNVNCIFNNLNKIQFDNYNCGPLLTEVISRIIKKENLGKINESCELIRSTHKSVLTNEFVEKVIDEKTLCGSTKHGEEKNIDWIYPYFGKYTLNALDHILHLRINDLELKGIKILQGIFIDQNHNNISNIFTQILNSTTKTTLVPLNLYNKHAVGLIFEKDKDNILQVKYLDSLNNSIPQELKKQLTISNLAHKVNFQEITVEQQKYANCGSEVIEDFVLYLTGKRISQEKAIELHSKLVENSLLDLTTTNTCLLFEQSNYDKFQPDIFLSGNHNEELC